MNPVAERAAVAWPLLVAETLIFGTAAFSRLVAPASDVPDTESGRTFEAFWRPLTLVVLVCSPLVLLTATADMAGVSLRAAVAMLPQVRRETHLGHVWSFSAALTVLLLAVAWLPTPFAIRSAGMCVLAGLLLLCGSLVSHAIDGGTPAVAVHFLHQVAAALWLGAIVGLWLCALRRGRDRDWLLRAAVRVSRLAGWTVAVLLLTGLWSAYYGLGGTPGRLTDTPYGQTLLVKAGAASLVLLIGAGNRSRLMSGLAEERSRRALLRNVGIESLLLVAILGLAALLANTPPALHGGTTSIAAGARMTTWW